MTSARSVVTIQPSCPEKQRVLPKYDWPMKMVNVTPGVTRIFSYELQTIDGKEQLKMNDDNAIVFNRPKFWIGSGGTVWASEFMKMRHNEPLLFTSDLKDKELVKSSINQANIKLMDSVKFYDISSVKDDVLNSSFDSPHRCYEQSRLRKLSSALQSYKTEIEEIPLPLNAIIEEMSIQLIDLDENLAKSKPTVL